MKLNKKRILSWFLTCALILSLAPMGIVPARAVVGPDTLATFTAGTAAGTSHVSDAASAVSATLTASGGRTISATSSSKSYYCNAWNTESQFWQLDFPTTGYEGIIISFGVWNSAANTGLTSFKAQYKLATGNYMDIGGSEYNIGAAIIATPGSLVEIALPGAANDQNAVSVRLVATSTADVIGRNSRIANVAITGTAIAAANHKAPVFSPAGGTTLTAPALVASGSTVTLSKASGTDADAKIYYEINGTTDLTAGGGTEYSAPIVINGTTTITAAVRGGSTLGSSPMVTAYYDVATSHSAPVFSVVGGAAENTATLVTSGSTVALNLAAGADSSAKIYYALDTTTNLTTGGTEYTTTPIPITGPTVIRAIVRGGTLGPSLETAKAYYNTREMTIAQAIAYAQVTGNGGKPVTLTGTVTCLASSSNNYYVEDNTGGILAYGSGFSAYLGQKITFNSNFTGSASGNGLYSGAPELSGITSVTVVDANANPQSLTTTISAIKATGTYGGGLSNLTGRYVKLAGAEVTVINGANYTVKQGADTIVVYTGSAITGIAVGDYVDAIGAVTYSSSSGISISARNPAATYVTKWPATTAPTAAPAGGSTSVEAVDAVDNTSITVASTDGGTIYYTMNGSAPTSASSSVASGGAILLNYAGGTELTLKLLAVATGKSPSAVVTYSYKTPGSLVAVKDPTAYPVNGSTVLEGATVTLDTETDGADIWYTTDNSTPSATNGTKFTSAITLNFGTGTRLTIKAIAVKSGMTDSTVKTFTYTKYAAYTGVGVFKKITSVSQFVPGGKYVLYNPGIGGATPPPPRAMSNWCTNTLAGGNMAAADISSIVMGDLIIDPSNTLVWEIRATTAPDVYNLYSAQSNKYLLSYNASSSSFTMQDSPANITLPDANSTNQTYCGTFKLSNSAKSGWDGAINITSTGTGNRTVMIYDATSFRNYTADGNNGGPIWLYLLDESITLTKETKPAASISYLNQQLTGLTASAKYWIEVNSVGSFKSADASGVIGIEETWINSTIAITKCGDGTSTKNSDAQSLAVKDRPAAPTGLSATPISVPTATDGTITGVTTAMEWREKTAGSWATCSGSTIIGLGEGEYLVRYLATGSEFASKTTLLTVLASTAIKATAYQMTVAEWNMNASTPSGTEIKSVAATGGENKAGATLEMFIGGAAQATGNATNSTTAGLFISNYGWSTYTSPAFAYNADKSKSAQWVVKTNSKNLTDLEFSFSMYSTAAGPRDFDIEVSTDQGTTWATFAKYQLTVVNSIVSFRPGDLLQQSISDKDSIWFRAVVSSGTRYSGASGAISGNYSANSFKVTGKYIDFADRVKPVMPDEQGVVLLHDTVRLNSNTSGADIQYSFDGTTWTASPNATLNTLPCTLYAKATKSGLTDSFITKFMYTQKQLGLVTSSSPSGSATPNTQITFTPPAGASGMKYEITTKSGAVGEQTLKDQTYSGPITLIEASFPYIIKVWAIGTNYKDGEAVTFSYGMKLAQPKLFFGQLHSHTKLSDGAGEVEDAFKYAREVAKLDFFAVTDHSNFFGGDSTSAAANTLYLDSGNGHTASNADNANWLRGKKAADDARTPNFASIYGYEMTWSGGPGHINTFNTEGWVSRNNTALNDKLSDNGMRAYYELLARTPESVSQFNHPGATFGNFTNFSYYKPEYDAVIDLVEVGNGEGAIGTGGYFPSYEQYTMALDKGWHLAPTNNQDNHKMLWGTANDARDVILTDDLSEQGVYQALRDLRCYATEVKDLRIFYEVNGKPLGTVLNEVPESATFTAKIENPTAGNTVKSVELVTNGGVPKNKVTPGTQNYDYSQTIESPAAGYYYLRVIVTTRSGDRTAVTAPVWLGTGKLAGISEVTRSVTYPVTDEKYSLTTELFNSESEAVTVRSLKLEQGATVLANFPALNQSIPANGTFKKAVDVTPSVAGDVTVTVTAVILFADSTEQTYTFSLGYEVLASGKLTYIGVDGSHDNEYIAGNYADSVKNFSNLALDYGVRVVTLTSSDQLIAATGNPQYKALILSPPSRRNGTNGRSPYKTYSDAELTAIASFAEGGGTVVLAGWSNIYENYPLNNTLPLGDHMAAQQNKILAAIGSTLRIGDDAASDAASNPGKKDARVDKYRLYLTDKNKSFLWSNNSWLLTDVDASQEYSQYGGSTVYTVAPENRAQWDAAPSATVPSSVIPAVVLSATGVSEDRESTDQSSNGGATTQTGIGTTNYKNNYTLANGRHMVLASEKVTHSGGGTSQVIVSGGLFITDFEVDFSAPDNIFDALANRLIAINLIRSVEPVPDITSIADAKTLSEGTKVTIEGIATSNVHAAGSATNTGFFDCIYVQDELGNGINLFPVASGVAEGQKIRVTGTVSAYQGETQIQVKKLVVIDRSIHKQTPAALTTAASMDSANTGKLVKLTGVVSDVVIAGDIVGQFTVNDGSGPALIYLNSYITPSVSLSFLKNGVNVTVTGLASIGENYADGNFLPRIRVRDRNEIINNTPEIYVSDTVVETPAVIPFSTVTVTPSAANAEQNAQAEAAVQKLSDAKSGNSGVEITITTPPVMVSGKSGSPAVTTLILPKTVDVTKVTSMAVLNADGSLTAVPTRIDSNGNVVVLMSGNATLVPLNVQAHFTDITGLAHVTDEINRAASMMLVEGRGNGIFDPTALVTNREAVTVFLRAMGVPTDWSSAWDTGAKHGLSKADSNPTGTMNRIDTAALIVASLKDLGMKPTMTLAKAKKTLEGFTDLGGLSDAERINLAICVKLGIYQGQGNGIMNPNGALQRSAIASLAVRLQDVMLGK